DLVLLSQVSGRLLDELPPGFRIFMTLDAGMLDGGVLPNEAAQVLNAPGECVRLGVITPAERERLAAQPVYAEIAKAHDGEPVLMGQLMVFLDRITDALQTPDQDGYWQQMAGRGPDAEVSRSGFRQALKHLLATARGDGPPLLDEVYSGNAKRLRPH